MVSPIVYWVIGGIVLWILIRVDRINRATYIDGKKSDTEEHEKNSGTAKETYTLKGRKIVMRNRNEE